MNFWVIKKDGRKEPFNPRKITESIWIAAQRVGGKNKHLAQKLSNKVIKQVTDILSTQKEITTYKIGEIVEKVLVENGHYKTAREYILWREKSLSDFKRKSMLGVKDDLGFLTYNSLYVLKTRYLRKNEKGQTVETPCQMLERVAKFVAKAEISDAKQKEWEQQFLRVMLDWQFLPGTRVLANAGKKNPQLANCFVFDIKDSIDDIFKSLYESTITKKYGGGCGYNFSKLRPKDDLVAGEPGLAAGPVEIMKLFDLPTSIFRQQGKYESGNMSVLNVNHPDIVEFISCKEHEGVLTKTNISVGITNDFMQAVAKDKIWKLVNPRTKKVVNKIKARLLWELIATYAHKSGDPGLFFIDNVNKNNPVKDHFGLIAAPNVCGEIPQYPYECCNLGYMNLTRFIKHDNTGKAYFDFDNFEKVVAIAIRFMDNVIDMSWFPVKEQTKTIRSFRRLGLGVVGLADVLVDLGIKYDSKEAYDFSSKLAKSLYYSAFSASIALGKEKCPFPYVKYSIWKSATDKPRNVAVTTLPPSSSNAAIFGISFSIEPYFALAFYQNVLGGVRIENVNYKLEKVLRHNNIHVSNLFERLFASHGSIQNIKEIPLRIKRLFRVAHDISWKDHIKMQAVWQKYIDNAITKTVNMPNEATVDDVQKAYMLAWKLGCKGITIYRDSSKKDQVIEFGRSRKCPDCGNTLIKKGRCWKCEECGYSSCEV